MKAMEKISKVSFECTTKIEKIKRQEAQDKRIIEALTNEQEASRTALTAAEEKADAALKFMEDMKASHLDMVQILHNWNQEITLEQDAT